MPSTNIPRVVVLRIRHADDASLRADIQEAAERQKSLARASPYHRRGRTLIGCADPSTPRRRIKQNLDNVNRRGRMHGPILARHGDHNFNRTSAAAGRGRASKRTALKYEPQAIEGEPLVLQLKKLKKVKQCKKEKLGAWKNRQGEGQSTPVDNTLTSTTQVDESKNRLSRLPTISSAPPASHHPTSRNFRLRGPANNFSNAGLDDETPGQTNPRNGDNPIDSGGEKFVDHSGPAHHEDLTSPTMHGMMGKRPMVAETISWPNSVQSEQDIGKATTVNTYERSSREARKEWYSRETPPDPSTAADWDHRPLVTLQQQVAGKPGHEPECPPSRDKRARPGLMAYGEKLKRNIMRRLHREREKPCAEPRQEKMRSIHAWQERVVNRWSIPTEINRWSIPTEINRWSSPTGISRWSSPTGISRWSSPTGINRWSSPTEINRWSSPTEISITTTEVGRVPSMSELAGDDSFYRHLSLPDRAPGGFAEAGGGTCRIVGGQVVSPSRQSVARNSPRSGILDAAEVDGEERYEIDGQEGSADKSLRYHFSDHPLCPPSICDEDEDGPCGLVGSHIPRLSSFRTKDELSRYLRPEADPAELPAYEEVMRKDTNTPAAISQSENGTLGACDQEARGSPGRALTKPEDIWLYTPRSCTTCGDFGLLPLHYCAQCKKLRVDMCSECYSMGHNTCQQAGHDVLETGRMQDIPNQKSKTTSDPGSSSDSAIRKCTEVVPSHILDKILTFVAEERSYMREEMKRARSYTAIRQQIAADDRAGAKAARTAKLKALPALITKEEERRVLEVHKSLRSVKDVAYLLHDDDDTDASQANANPELQTPESLERGSIERKLTALRGTIRKRPDSCLPDDLQKDVFPPGSLPPSQGRHKELSDMDSKLQLQEQLQSFREREIGLREKELELREREFALQLNEKRLLAPEHLNTLPRDGRHSLVSCIPTSLTREPNCHPGPVKRSLPAPGSTSKHSCLDPDFHSPCSTLSMSHYDSTSCTSSPSGSTAAPARDGFQVSSILIKQLLSNFFLRRTRKGIRTRTGKRARQDDSLQHTKGSSKVEPSSSCTPRKRARNGVLARRHSGRSDRSGTDSGSNKRCKKTPSTRAISGRLLACPYVKFDPFRYSSSNQDESDYRRCSTHCLRDIPRLKQHLYRVHQRPEHHCPRCFAIFGSKLEASEHARLPVQCATASCPFDEKFDDDQLRELKRRQQGKSEKDCWFSIYRVLFPNALPPADPYLESPAALLTSQLSSPGFSQNLGESIIARAGLDPESGDRVLEAIRESLPLFVQQLLQRPNASANSSSASLPGSSTTPGSSSGNDFVAPGVQENIPGLQNGVRLSDPQTSDHPWAPVPSSTDHNLPNSQGGRLMSQQRSSGLRTPAHVTNNHVRADARHAHIGAHTTNATRTRLTGRQPSSEFQVDSHDSLSGNGQSAAAPMAISPTYGRRSITNSSILASNTSVALMAPPPPPQQALHATTLKPRRSMDSGYASMHTVTSSDGVLANPVTSSFALSGMNQDMLSGNPSGAVNTYAATDQRSISFDEADGRTENETLENDQIDHTCDSSTGIFPMKGEDPFMPYDYSTIDAGFIGPDSNTSSLDLPFMAALDHEAISSSYSMVDDLYTCNHWE